MFPSSFQILYRALTLVGLAIAFVLLVGCELPDKVQEGDATGEILPILDPATTVCEPFSDEANPSWIDHGVLAKLYTLLPGQPQYSSALDYANFGNEEPFNIFFNLIHVPTRPWNRGFTTLNGTVVTNTSGEAVYEYFGVKFMTQIKLGPNDAPGYYQMALLSDDGAVLNMNDQLTEPRTIVNNDGVHPTRLGCASEPVYLAPGTQIPTELFYHQGPRYHIAMSVLWRPWNGSADDPLCGQQGNSLYFDSTQTPPAPQQAFYDLLQRGWKVLEPTNYVLPTGVAENPCSNYDPQNPGNL